MSNNTAEGLWFVSLIFSIGVGLVTKSPGWGLISFVLFPLALCLLMGVCK